MRETFSEAHRRLRVAAEGGSRADAPSSLPVSEIALCAALFQPRSGKAENGVDDVDHAAGLVRALRDKLPDAPFLDPICVVAVGKTFYCVDGHYRIAAYRNAGVTAPVPVRHFKGDLEEAVAEAVRCNSKASLPMSFAERMEAAWRLTLLGRHSKRETAEATGASPSTVAKMRRMLRKLREEDPEAVPDSYFAALRGNDDMAAEFTDEMREAEIVKMEHRLRKTFGKRILYDRLDLFAEALERRGGRQFVGRLTLAWGFGEDKSSPYDFDGADEEDFADCQF